MASAIEIIPRKRELGFQEADKRADRKMSEKNKSPFRLQRFEELPAWYQDNPHVRTGYRPVSNSIQSCVQSLTYLHNETLNIYTHLLPAGLLALLLPTLQLNISQVYPTAPLTDRLILTLTPLTALITFGLSTNYHMLMNHSHAVSSICLLLDFTGILCLILSSFISGIYTGFYCDPTLQQTYWAMITALIFISAGLVLHPMLQGPPWRSHRTAAFILTAFSGFVPIVHGILRYGWEDMWHRSGMPWWFAEGLWYGIGAVFFSMRIPEKLTSEKWDLIGSSHQLFHICVVLGSSCHCWGVWRAWEVNVMLKRC
ncbi:adiponectin receptor protein 1 [Delitschia confertaspora ATCC 74209]|uniref:Adiponectin receptor protein 1 n=1 Tax=Delitschia confertaspora ATCC 74209 TaxID=1513339 RepID=A0A9P4MR62_9PLEO|nr:adiponectin receptor protein 1 [Delitschia confertaspora ATCC 74209]